MNTDIPLWAGIPASILLIAGGIIALIGSVGLLRFKNFVSRIHAPTMGNTMGAGCVLLASILVFSSIEERFVIHEILITLLLLITSPVTAMLLMRASAYRGQRERGEFTPNNKGRE
ncbi:monovalent cation/H(+) antiporter subunit G [Bordetella tumulicola]|uniref:monovalent cation/H(+) antiporter subunit G n=1 Tax=Bordetella tumulicola TaxID=1649133 RepID=UPI0039EF3315